MEGLTHNRIEVLLLMGNKNAITQLLDEYCVTKLHKLNYMKVSFRKTHVVNIRHRIPRKIQVIGIACYLEILKHYGEDTKPSTTECIKILACE